LTKTKKPSVTKN